MMLHTPISSNQGSLSTLNKEKAVGEDTREATFTLGSPRLNIEAKRCLAYHAPTFKQRFGTLTINKPFFTAVIKSATDSRLRNKDGLNTLPAYKNIETLEQARKTQKFLTDTEVLNLHDANYPGLGEYLKIEEKKLLDQALLSPKWTEQFEKIGNHAIPYLTPESLRKYSLRLREEKICSIAQLEQILFKNSDENARFSPEEIERAQRSLHYVFENRDQIKTSIFSNHFLMKLAAKDFMCINMFLKFSPELVERGYKKDDLERNAIQHLDSHEKTELIMSLQVLKTHGMDLESAGFDKAYQLEQLSREDSARYLCKIIQERTSVGTSALLRIVSLKYGTTPEPIIP